MFSTTTDKTLICSDCGQEFAFTASEQQLRPRGAGPVPTERHEARLLQRLLLEAAQLLDLDRSIDRSPADPAGLHRFRPPPRRSVMRPVRIGRPTLARRQDLCIRARSSSWRQPHVASRSWGASDAAIERHERRAQILRHGDVPRIVSGQVVPELPDTLRMWLVRKEIHPKLY